MHYRKLVPRLRRASRKRGADSCPLTNALVDAGLILRWLKSRRRKGRPIMVASLTAKRLRNGRASLTPAALPPERTPYTLPVAGVVMPDGTVRWLVTALQEGGAS